MVAQIADLLERQASQRLALLAYYRYHPARDWIPSKKSLSCAFVDQNYIAPNSSVSSLFDIHPFTINGRREGHEVKLWAANHEGTLATEAIATLGTYN